MKKFKLITMIGLVLALTAGCSSSGIAPDTVMKKQVTTLAAAVQKQPVTATYLGYVMPQDMKGYAFKSPGRIAEVKVEVGDTVAAGDILAVLDTTDLDFQLDSVRWQMETAKAQYEQVIAGAADEEIRILELSRDLAEENYALAKGQAEDSQILFENGILSEFENEQIKLNAANARTGLGQVSEQLAQAVKGASEENLDMARSQYELAKVQYESVQALVDDAVISASGDGVVIDVPYQSGTLIDAGMPVVVTRVSSNYIQLGLTQKDMDSIDLGDLAAVEYEGTVYQGIVSFIDEFADSGTGTYLLEVEPASGEAFDVPFGSICEVTFEKGMEEGIWVPLSSILNEGIDYVFLAKDGYAVKQRVDRLGIRENLVLVSGLEEGNQVIVEGILSINEGDPVEMSGGGMDE